MIHFQGCGHPFLPKIWSLIAQQLDCLPFCFPQASVFLRLQILISHFLPKLISNYFFLKMKALFAPTCVFRSKLTTCIGFHFLNADGRLQAMEEGSGKLKKYMKEGLSVDGSSIKGMMSVEKSDMRVMPDAKTFRTLQIGDFCHHRYMCMLYDHNGKPHPKDPRQILQRIVEQAHAKGYEPYMFSEIEFYIVDLNGKPIDSAGYCSLPPEDRAYEFRQELGAICKSLRISVKRIHHENGCGQNEIEFNLKPCLENADDTVLCMWVLELLAAKRNWRILFSPKPFPKDAGSGLHHHIMLRSPGKYGSNLFLNENFNGIIDKPEDNMQRISLLCQQGIAGLLKYADDITAVFAASPESFARLQPGFEAPIFKAWDFSNRTALVRVPSSGMDDTRFEYRGGDLSGGPHIYGAVLLAAVLRGVTENLAVPPPANFNVEHLSDAERDAKGIKSVPLSMEKCIDILKTSTFLRESLGEGIVQHFVKRDEELIAATQK